MAHYLDELLLEFKHLVHSRASEVDPTEERDWLDLAFGWAMGRGLPVGASEEFVQLYSEKTRTCC